MKTTRTCCTRHCGNGCALLVQERADGSVKITGDPEHPATRGFICAKTAGFMDRLNAPNRIVEPMIRKNGVLQAVEWNEALALVAGRINALRATPERMLHLFYVASYGVLFRASPALFGLLGASEASGDYCLDAGHEAQCLDFGQVMQPGLDELRLSRRVVNWGRNLDAQAMLMGRELRSRRTQGLKVLSITPGDPGYAQYSDHVVTIRPGTDRFLALAVVRLFMERGADLALARARGLNWAEFQAMAGVHGVESLLAACDVRREEAELVADYYQDGPTATLFGRGLQRYRFGGENVRFIDALALCAGWVGTPGGGIYYCQGDLGHIRYDWHKRPAPAPRSLPTHDMGRAIAEADPPVEFVYVDGTNAVNQSPHAGALRDALNNTFVVAVEAFMTDTAECADVVLPPALLLETEDLVRCSAHGFVHHSARVFAPRGKSRSNFDICKAIAARLEPPLPFPDAEQVMADALRAERMTTSLEDIRARSYVPSPPMQTPFAGGRFAHADGLARLPEQLHGEPPAPQEFPLRLLSLVGRKHLLSQIPENEQTGLPTIRLSPENGLLAANGGPLNIDKGAPCFLATELGRMPVRVELLEGLHPQAAYVTRGGWLKTGWGVNALIGPHDADLAGQCAYYSQWCRVDNTANSPAPVDMEGSSC